FSCLFLFRPPVAPLDLHSFPTRRSSDLVGGRLLHTIAPTRTLGDAITLMGRHNVNSLLVVGENDRLLGIVTSRDVLFAGDPSQRSEEHTSELQSRSDLVCRLLLEKKNKY